MNIKRISFWTGFVVVLGLIVWGLIVSMNKPHIQSFHSQPGDVRATDHVRGPAGAPVTLIEYSDFQCPACGMYYPIIEKLFNESSTTLRMVYRHFPLPQHKNALLAARASEAASNQGKFWDMYGLIFTNQTAWSDLDTDKARALFLQYATQLGLNTVSYTKDLDSDAVKAIIDADQQEGVSIGINATPTFFLNGKAIVNPQSYEEFKKLVDQAAH